MANQNLVRVENIAQLFGVSVRRVQQITQEGIIQTVAATDENGRACRRYDLIPTVQRYVQYLSEKAYGKAHRSDREIMLKEQTMEATLRMKDLEGKLKEINLKIKDGRYLPREQVLADYIAFFTTFKKFAAGIPSRVVSLLTGLISAADARRVRKEIATDINGQLASFVLASVEIGPEEVKKDVKRRKAVAKEIPCPELSEGSAEIPEAPR